MNPSLLDPKVQAQFLHLINKDESENVNDDGSGSDSGGGSGAKDHDDC